MLEEFRRKKGNLVQMEAFELDLKSIGIREENMFPLQI